MTGGLLDHLTEASHISIGLGCTFRHALEIVKAAHEYEAKQNPADEWAKVIYGNVIYGVDFAAGRRSDNGLA